MIPPTDTITRPHTAPRVSLAAHAGLLSALAIAVSIAAIAANGYVPRTSLTRYTLLTPVVVLCVLALIADISRASHRRRSGAVRPLDSILPQIVVIAALAATLAVLLGLARAASTLVWFVPLQVSSAILAAGFGIRTGSQRFCAKCEYPFIESTDSDPSPELCPECGAPWLRFNGTRKGVRRRSPALLWAGAATLLLFILGFGWSIGGGFGLAKHTPTRVLVAQVLAGSGSDYFAWEELGKRTLDAGQTRRLATALLDDRRAGDRRRSGGQWLDAQMLAGTLSPDLQRRFYEDSFSPRLFAPRQARVGQPVTVRLSGPHESFAPGIGVPRLYLEGLYVGDSPSPREDGHRAGAVIFPHEINYIRHPDAAPDDEYFLKSPSVTFTPDRPGPLVIRARGLIYYGPWGFDRTALAQLGPDGKYIPPPGAVFSRELETEVTIEVLP